MGVCVYMRGPIRKPGARRVCAEWEGLECIWPAVVPIPVPASSLPVPPPRSLPRDFPNARALTRIFFFFSSTTAMLFPSAPFPLSLPSSLPPARPPALPPSSSLPPPFPLSSSRPPALPLPPFRYDVYDEILAGRPSPRTEIIHNACDGLQVTAL